MADPYLSYLWADDAKGSVGFVLNKASPMKVRELQLAAACPGACLLGACSLGLLFMRYSHTHALTTLLCLLAGFIETFSSQRLQIGGHVHLDHVTVLHRFMGLAG